MSPCPPTLAHTSPLHAWNGARQRLHTSPVPSPEHADLLPPVPDHVSWPRHDDLHDWPASQFDESLPDMETGVAEGSTVAVPSDPASTSFPPDSLPSLDPPTPRFGHRLYRSLQQRYIAAGHDLDWDQFRRWRYRVAFLQAVLEGEHQPDPEGSTSRDLRALLGHGPDIEAMRNTWEARRAAGAREDFFQIVGEAVEFHLDSAHFVLGVTARSAPWASAVEDVAWLLLRFRRGRMDDAYRESYADFLCDVVMEVVRTLAPSRLAVFTGWGLSYLFRDGSVAKARQLHELLVRHEVDIWPYAVMRLVQKLSKVPEHKAEAVSLMISIARHPAVRTKSIWWNLISSMATSILATDKGGRPYVPPHDSPLHSRAGGPGPGPGAAASGADATHSTLLIKYMVDQGLSPNLINYTAWIRSLCLENKYRSALQVAVSMEEQGIRSDEHVYSILFNAAKRNVDLETVGAVLSRALGRNLVGRFLCNDMIHSVFEFAVDEQRAHWRKHRALPVWHLMLKLYARIYRTEPLQRLIPTELARDLGPLDYVSMWRFPHDIWPLVMRYLPQKQPGHKEEPCTIILTVMVIAYVKNLGAHATVAAFYSFFRALLDRSDPLAVAIVREQESRVHNAILKKITEWPEEGCLRAGINIVRDMIQNVEATYHQRVREHHHHHQSSHHHDADGHTPTPTTSLYSPHAQPQPYQPLHYPPPNVHTWSVLLYAYLAHSRRDIADEVLRTMADYGVQPNLVTWNIIVSGRARLQDVDGTVRALRQFEQAGFRPDRRTAQALAHLHDQKAALAKLESRLGRAGPEDEEHRDGSLVESAWREQDQQSAMDASP